ncbi:hypothetical protein GGI1_24131 [Acidithiobacillus sp. GGI-221]|nr:hypothetical protein GGI1_24131 [Acidithiobacillus sp. GGI-221]
MHQGNLLDLENRLLLAELLAMTGQRRVIHPIIAGDTV